MKKDNTDSTEESFFDKFMDDILIKESKNKSVDEEEDTPARKLLKRREHYLNSMRTSR